MLSSVTAVLSLALAHVALGAVYITSPVGSTVATGGQVLNVQWADDGQTPSCTTIGPSSIDIYVGSSSQQTFLQNLAASVDVGKTSSISSTIFPSIGPSGEYYFVRFTSLGYKAPGTTYNYEAFSAKFTINSMTGTFNASVLAQVNNAASSPLSTSQSATTTTINNAVASVSKASVVASASASTTASTHVGAAGHSLAAVSTPALLALVGLASWFAL